MANLVPQALAYVGLIPAGVLDRDRRLFDDPALTRYLDIILDGRSSTEDWLVRLAELDDDPDSTGVLLLSSDEFAAMRAGTEGMSLDASGEESWFIEALELGDVTLLYPQDHSIADHLAAFLFVGQTHEEIELVRPPPLFFSRPISGLRRHGSRKSGCGYRISWDAHGSRVVTCKQRACVGGCSGFWADIGDGYWRYDCRCPD